VREETDSSIAIEFTELGTFDFQPQTGKPVWSDFAKRHFAIGSCQPTRFRWAGASERGSASMRLVAAQ
jgi:hypothetical protein